jgi:hypothetical protein
MTCNIYRDNNNINRVRFIDGKPYVYCGETSGGGEPPLSICASDTISNDFTITFVDNAHPLYVIGSGNIGSMWGADVNYYNTNIDPNFPSCANILFDVDTPFVARGSYKGEPITEDPFYVYPSGVDNNSPVGCELPMPIQNVVQIPRPSGGTESNGSYPAIGTISQTTFKDYIISGIESLWGINFWTRMAAASPNHKLWIIRADTVALDTQVIQPGIDLFKTYLTNAGIAHEEYFSYCNDNERYLSWIVDAITYGGVSNSCNEVYQPIDIFVGSAQSSGTHPTGKLVTVSIEGLSASSGTINESPVSLTLSSAFDTITNYADINWADITNNVIATYQEFDVANARQDYLTSIQFLYENGVPRVITDSYCYQYTDPYTYPDYTRNIWQGDVPLDKYGIPNGTVQVEFITIDSYQNCTPKYANIVFSSYPNTANPPQPPAPGVDCAQFNP